MRLTCPQCKKVIEDAPDDLPSRPFCSRQCKLIDLDNWLNERYLVPGPVFAGDTEDDRSLN
ncbi:MAG TPA: DNA gyrase inhibitor YacG [Polyangiaceae bacterium]|nr:DNA gyrase inhibitor YacG [Polyangiaceae bacterium]